MCVMQDGETDTIHYCQTVHPASVHAQFEAVPITYNIQYFAAVSPVTALRMDCSVIMQFWALLRECDAPLYWVLCFSLYVKEML